MDTLDRILFLVFVIFLGLLNHILAKEYTDKEICKLKNGIILNGECVEVVKK